MLVKSVCGRKDHQITAKIDWEETAWDRNSGNRKETNSRGCWSAQTKERSPGKGIVSNQRGIRKCQIGLYSKGEKSTLNPPRSQKIIRTKWQIVSSLWGNSNQISGINQKLEQNQKGLWLV